MAIWDYVNIGASAKPEHKKHVEKIFEYIGYASKPNRAAGGYDECIFDEPDVYGCETSDYDDQGGNKKRSFCFFGDTDLLYLLNALFPRTTIYVHSTRGNTHDDAWEIHDVIYDTDSMTIKRKDSYTDYSGTFPSGKKFWELRLVLKAPEAEYVEALIELSAADGNAELTALLSELFRRLKDGLIVYEDNGSDIRKVGEEYNVKIEGEMEDEDFDNGWDIDEEDEEDEDEDDF